MKTEYLPFTPDMIPAAGKLLAARHRRNRKMFPALPERFEKPDVAEGAIKVLFEKEYTCGYMAIRKNNIVAYLIGTSNVQPWGRCGWVYLPGSALLEGESVETLQDLYALLGDDWVKRGVFIHHTYQSVTDKDLVEAWFNLDFGKERIDAILDFKQIHLPHPVSVQDGIQIRRAGPGDSEHLAGMSHLIFRELEKAPYWHPTPPEVWEELREGWGELAVDKNVDVWLAMEGQKTVGTIASWKEEEGPAEMLVGPKTFTFSVAATRPEYRGRGIATALTWTCLAHGREQGYEYCYTDWISPNLAASRFWPRFGFKEVAYRLTKQINPMIAWTRE
jgi:ribosomal protein S18 acetylase RimI-like enzyme